MLCIIFFIILLEVILGHNLTYIDVFHSQGENIGKASVDEMLKYVCVFVYMATSYMIVNVVCGMCVCLSSHIMLVCACLKKILWQCLMFH